jgi:hypothetical protein
MRRAALLLLPLLVALAAAPAGTAGPSRDEETAKVFSKIQKHWEKGDVEKIARLLPPEGKVKLALQGVKPGEYRREQAHALLRKYFESIETKEFKPTGKPKGASAQFKHVFLVRADDHKETRYTFITLDREGDEWVIVEILED